MSTDATDTDVLLSESNEVTLSDGTVVAINRLKTRETMALLKILTRGAGAALSEIQVSADMDPSEFTQTLLTFTVLSIPEAEEESIEFIRRMVQPTGLIEGRKLSKPEKEINEEKEAHLQEITENPEVTDLVAIISKIVTIEAPHIQSLGKSLAALWKFQTAASESRKTSSKND